jgi:hypothetical protein
LANKTQKTAGSRAAKRGRAEIRRRTRKRDPLTLLDPLASLVSPREYRIVKAIAESTEDFKTGRYEP